MKKTATILSFVLLISSAYRTVAQSAMSCCSRNATSTFAMLGADESFRAQHLSPLPFHYTPAKGSMVTIKTGDGKDASAFMIKSATPSKKYLIVFQEWWGLNDYIKQEAENLAEELNGVNVIAPDLYDGKIGTTPEEAGSIMKETKDERIRAIIEGVLRYAGPDARIQTIGWCFGGGWSLQASEMAGKNAAGCVMYYGMPETNQDKLKTINFPVLGIFASKDDHITPEIVKQFEAEMQAAGKKVSIHFYDAVHAFANPSNPNFDKTSAEDAHGKAVAFLRENFK